MNEASMSTAKLVVANLHLVSGIYETKKYRLTLLRKIIYYMHIQYMFKVLGSKFMWDIQHDNRKLHIYISYITI